MNEQILSKQTNQEQEDPKALPLLDHLIELRQRLIYSFLFFIICFAVSYGFADHIYDFLASPLAERLEKFTDQPQMIYTALWEGFTTQIRVAFYAAFFVSFPFILIQAWIFIAPGLYKDEKKVFLPFLIATPFLFVAGASLVYFVIMPLAWDFFLGFQQVGQNEQMNIVLQAKIGEYLSLVIRFIFAFGLSFQLPILLTLLTKIGALQVETLQKNRKYAVVIIVAFAAIITPPDVISQIGLAIPIYLLYEISIFCAKMAKKKNS